MYFIYKSKKLKIVKVKSLNRTFSAVCHHHQDAFMISFKFRGLERVFPNRSCKDINEKNSQTLADGDISAWIDPNGIRDAIYCVQWHDNKQRWELFSSQKYLFRSVNYTTENSVQTLLSNEYNLYWLMRVH